MGNQAITNGECRAVQGLVDDDHLLLVGTRVVGNLGEARLEARVHSCSVGSESGAAPPPGSEGPRRKGAWALWNPHLLSKKPQVSKLFCGIRKG
jgi:hypothetical protein